MAVVSHLMSTCTCLIIGGIGLHSTAGHTYLHVHYIISIAESGTNIYFMSRTDYVKHICKLGHLTCDFSISGILFVRYTAKLKHYMKLQFLLLAISLYVSLSLSRTHTQFACLKEFVNFPHQLDLPLSIVSLEKRYNLKL